MLTRMHQLACCFSAAPLPTPIVFINEDGTPHQQHNRKVSQKCWTGWSWLLKSHITDMVTDVPLVPRETMIVVVRKAKKLPLQGMHAAGGSAHPRAVADSRR